MKKLIVVFILGVIAGSSGFWLFRDGPLAKKLAEADRTSVAGRMMGAVEQQAAESRAEEVKQQLDAGGGSLTRQKPPPRVAFDDDRVNDVIEAKLKADPSLAGTKIKCETKGGEVTLSGTATSYDQIARALRLGFETDGLRKLTVTIKVGAN